MQSNQNSGHAVTEDFDAGAATPETEGNKPADGNANSLAEVTAAYRAALAEEDAANADLRVTLQSGQQQQEAVQASQPVEVAPTNPPPENEVADDVDDLNSYMESFLQRMKVNPSHTPAQQKQQEKSDQNAADVAAQQAPAAKEQPKYSGPKVAPECKDKLANMREVANATAQVSLSNHATRVLKRAGNSLVLSIVLAAMAGVVAWFANSTISYAFIAAVVLQAASMAAAWHYQAGLTKVSQGVKPKSE